MNSATDKSEAAILDRVFRPNAADWPRAAADAILNIGFDPSDRARMAELMEMAKDGDLSREQAEELEIDPGVGGHRVGDREIDGAH